MAEDGAMVVVRRGFKNMSEGDDENKVKDELDVDNDSKKLRLTLMEETLLLGLKDRSVSLYFFIYKAF